MATPSEIERERSPIAILRDRNDVHSSEDDIRLDDYLNDKLQTAADFQDLDSLIASVEEQRSQLQSQVCYNLHIELSFIANLCIAPRCPVEALQIERGRSSPHFRPVRPDENFQGAASTHRPPPHHSYKLGCPR